MAGFHRCEKRIMFVAKGGQMYRSIESRKSEEAGRRGQVAAILAARLSSFAVQNRGRYILYGSLARGEARHDSDVDLLIDFPNNSEAEAWRLAEDVCADLNVECDIKPLAWCDPKFVARIWPHARILG
jgi:predicted nucleotidyltransferase